MVEETGNSFMQSAQFGRPPSPKRKRRSSGHSMLEGAFTLIPTFAIIFGFCDIGLMLFRMSTLQNAVREGCRYAITFQTTGGLGQDGSIQTVVERYAMGVVKRTDSPQRIFVDYFSPSDMSTAIVGGGNIPGNIVEVSVKNLPLSWIAPLSGTWSGGGILYTSGPLTMSVYSSDMLGGLPAGSNGVAR